MHRRIWLGILGLLLSPCIAWSQEPFALVPGVRIRVTANAAGRSERRSGAVVTAGGDTLVLRLDGDGTIVPFALARISQLEVSRGRVGHFDTGAKIGFAVGAVTGALLACPPGNCDLSSGSWGRLQMIAGAFVLGAAGVLTGGVVGASYKTDRWEPLLPGRWRVNPLPTGPRDFGLILSLRW